VPRRQLVDDQLRAERRPRVRRTYAHDQEPARVRHDVGRERDRAEERQRRRERGRRAVARSTRRRSPGDRGNSRDDGDHRKHVTRANVLPEVASREREQQDEPERERRLHDGQRRVAQREQLQRPADDRQRDPADPQPLAREAGE